MADMPEAQRFVEACRMAHAPITGLRLLTSVRNHERATDMIRALVDVGDLVCVGPSKGCPKSLRGDLLGQDYTISP